MGISHQSLEYCRKRVRTLSNRLVMWASLKERGVTRCSDGRGINERIKLDEKTLAVWAKRMHEAEAQNADG